MRDYLYIICVYFWANRFRKRKVEFLNFESEIHNFYKRLKNLPLDAQVVTAFK